MDGLLARLAKKWTGAETFNERWQLAHPDNRLSREEREQALLLAFGRELCEELARMSCKLCFHQVPAKGIYHEVNDALVERGKPFRLVKCAATRIRKVGKGERP